MTPTQLTVLTRASTSSARMSPVLNRIIGTPSLASIVAGMTVARVDKTAVRGVGHGNGRSRTRPRHGIAPEKLHAGRVSSLPALPGVRYGSSDARSADDGSGSPHISKRSAEGSANPPDQPASPTLPGPGRHGGHALAAGNVAHRCGNHTRFPVLEGRFEIGDHIIRSIRILRGVPWPRPGQRCRSTLGRPGHRSLPFGQFMRTTRRLLDVLPPGALVATRQQRSISKPRRPALPRCTSPYRRIHLLLPIARHQASGNDGRRMTHRSRTVSSAGVHRRGHAESVACRGRLKAGRIAPYRVTIPERLRARPRTRTEAGYAHPVPGLQDPPPATATRCTGVGGVPQPIPAAREESPAATLACQPPSGYNRPGGPSRGECGRCRCRRRNCAV